MVGLAEWRINGVYFRFAQHVRLEGKPVGFDRRFLLLAVSVAAPPAR